ncbi:MBL fold metallo-hydrolase [Microbacterium sp. NPDC019599]|uniref:MBL fold metallo-hydrolase n=1 Tax=Microbacterium sp. NPDC019599 TaxID=3154690 RepID=UPI0033C0C8B1
MEIRPGLHRIQAPLGERFVALYLLEGTDAALLVDTGIRESITESLLPYLDEHGIPRDKVRWAIDTHCDFDHTGGNGALKAAIPTVRLLAHVEDQPLVEDIQRLIDERYGEFRDSDGFDDPAETTAYLRSVSDLVPLDGVLRGGEEFDLGGRSVTVLHVPGHSPGHVAVHDPANRALLIGDATLGRSVLFADGRAAFPPTYRDVEPYLDSIRRFREFDADLFLTAHYPVYQDAGVEGFLAESEEYVALIDDVARSVLASSPEPLTTLEIIRAAGERLGPWPAEALDYSVFPVTGNLERLEARGEVVSTRAEDGRRRWELVR